MPSTPDHIYAKICHQILQLNAPHPTRIGINGIDGSGKTTFAQKLADTLRAQTTRQVICASIDGFHNPRKIRYQKGRASAEGFYRDSFNFDALTTHLLAPLSSNKSYITQYFDLTSDALANQTPQNARPNAILILEGIFLFKKDILPYLDLKIFLEAPFTTALDRMLTRDKALFSSEAELKNLFHQRYMPGQQLYLDEVHPREISDVIIDSSNYHYKLLRSS